MSKSVKKEFLPFYFSDLDAVARHFEKKAAEGWMLESFGNTCKYTAAEPKKLRFNVILCPIKGSDNTEINAEARGFIEFCGEAGWNFVDHRGAVYAFCSEDEQIPDIVTDGKEQIESVKRIGKRNLGMSVFLLGLNITQLVLRLINALTETDPIVKNLNIVLAIFFAAAVILLLTALAVERSGEKKWTENARAALEAGKPIPPSDENVLRSRKIVSLTMLFAVAAAALGLLAYALATVSPAARCFLISSLIAALPFAALPTILKEKRPKAVNAIIVIGFVLGCLLLALMLFAVLGSAFNAFEAVEQAAKI